MRPLTSSTQVTTADQIAPQTEPQLSLYRVPEVATTQVTTPAVERCAHLYQLGWQQREAGHDEDALRAFRELLIMGRHDGHQGWINAAENAINDLTAQPTEVVETLQKTISLADVRVARRCNKAAILHAKGYFAAAIRVYESVLAVAGQGQYPLAMGRCLHGLGLINLEQKQYAKAEAHFRAAIEVLAGFDAPWQQAIALHNLAITHYQQGHYDQAKTYFQQSLNHWQTQADTLGLALTLNYLGRVYGLSQEAWLALGSFEAAIDVLNELAQCQDVREAAVDLLLQVALLCEQTHHGELAIAYLQDALAIAQTLPTPTTSQIIVYRLGQLYQQAGQWAWARHCYRQLA